MSEENVALAIAGHAAFNSGDIDAALEFLHPEIEWHPAFGETLLGTSVYHGHEGFRRYFEQLNEVFENFRNDPIEVHWFDSYVIVHGRVTLHGRASGIDMTNEVTTIWRFRDGKMAWGASYMDRAEGLAAILASEEELTEGKLTPIPDKEI